MSPKRRTIDEGARLVVPLISQGLKSGDCAVRLGVARSQIARYKERARELGLMPKVRPGTTEQLRAIKTGDVRKRVEALDHDVQQWILDNIPKGVTLVEFAFACLVDQCFEDLGE
jgi:transposase